jgi:hypothetical protein
MVVARKYPVVKSLWIPRVASHGTGLVDGIGDFEIGFWAKIYGVELVVAGAWQCDSNVVEVRVVQMSREREFRFRFIVSWVGLVRGFQECEFGFWLNVLRVGFWRESVHALAVMIDEDDSDGDEDREEDTEGETSDPGIGPLVRWLVCVVERCWVHSGCW